MILGGTQLSLCWLPRPSGSSQLGSPELWSPPPGKCLGRNLRRTRASPHVRPFCPERQSCAACYPLTESSACSVATVTHDATFLTRLWEGPFFSPSHHSGGARGAASKPQMVRWPRSPQLSLPAPPWSPHPGDLGWGPGGKHLPLYFPHRCSPCPVALSIALGRRKSNSHRRWA